MPISINTGIRAFRNISTSTFHRTLERALNVLCPQRALALCASSLSDDGLQLNVPTKKTFYTCGIAVKELQFFPGVPAFVEFSWAFLKGEILSACPMTFGGRVLGWLAGQGRVRRAYNVIITGWDDPPDKAANRFLAPIRWPN
jgi:hypothetical protein